MLARVAREAAVPSDTRDGLIEGRDAASGVARASAAAGRPQALAQVDEVIERDALAPVDRHDLLGVLAHGTRVVLATAAASRSASRVGVMQATAEPDLVVAGAAAWGRGRSRPRARARRAGRGSRIAGRRRGRTTRWSPGGMPRLGGSRSAV